MVEAGTEAGRADTQQRRSGASSFDRVWHQDLGAKEWGVRRRLAR
jgi:hypothetical protein